MSIGMHKTMISSEPDMSSKTQNFQIVALCLEAYKLEWNHLEFWCVWTLDMLNSQTRPFVHWIRDLESSFFHHTFQGISIHCWGFILTPLFYSRNHIFVSTFSGDSHFSSQILFLPLLVPILKNASHFGLCYYIRDGKCTCDKQQN